MAALAVAIAAAVVWVTQLKGAPVGQQAVVPRCVAKTDAGDAALAPDQAANAALIAAVADAKGMSPRAVTIALATAMQESKLRNLDYGDLDSLGLFQQRPSQGWGTEEQVQDPIYAAGAFYDALALVPDFENLPITEAAQAVQRSAYPDLYAQHETTARSFASALTGHSPAALACVFHAATEPGSADTLLATLATEWGQPMAAHASVVTPSATTSASPAPATQIRLQGDSATQTWALAQWAVAKGADLGVVTVQVDDLVWHRDKAEWVQAETGATAGSGSATVPAAIVTLAGPAAAQ
ncbi:MAG: cobalt transporter [Bifidobacteriaceae bacterium]|nr:cobalt transporter [Bifidobacteriaceae bacterium]